MKKIIFLTLLIISITILSACQNEIENDDDIEEELPVETEQYQMYLNDTNPRVTIVVENHGTLVLELFYEVAPNTVRNFIQYVEDGFYNGLIFHRIIEGFMIQGGGGANPACTIYGEFKNNGFENNLLHSRGVISMARTMAPNSATSQFFIMHQNAPHLNSNYAGFGGLISGFDVLDSIATVTTGAQDRPLEDVVIRSVTIDLRGQTYSPRECHN